MLVVGQGCTALVAVSKHAGIKMDDLLVMAHTQGAWVLHVVVDWPVVLQLLNLDLCSACSAK